MHEEIPIFKTNENNRNPQQPGHHRLSQCAQRYNTEYMPRGVTQLQTDQTLILVLHR